MPARSLSSPMWLAVVLLFFATSAGAAADCSLKIVASLKLHATAAGYPYVDMQINGHDVHMLVDTLGISSTLNTPLADALGLNHHRDRAVYEDPRFLQYSITDYVDPDSISLGRLHSRDLNLFLRPAGSLPTGIDGTLGSGILSAYDVEIDFRNGILNLISPDHCGGQVVYWTKSPYVRLPITFEKKDGEAEIPIMLDGHAGFAGFDTSSTETIAQLDGVLQIFGWTEHHEGLKLIEDHPHWRSYSYTFKSLSFDGVNVSNPKLVLETGAIMTSALAPRLGVTLGLDLLRRLHLYIAYKERALYATGAEAH